MKKYWILAAMAVALLLAVAAYASDDDDDKDNDAYQQKLEEAKRLLNGDAQTPPPPAEGKPVLREEAVAPDAPPLQAPDAAYQQELDRARGAAGQGDEQLTPEQQAPPAPVVPSPDPFRDRRKPVLTGREDPYWGPVYRVQEDIDSLPPLAGVAIPEGAPAWIGNPGEVPKPGEIQVPAGLEAAITGTADPVRFGVQGQRRLEGRRAQAAGANRYYLAIGTTIVGRWATAIWFVSPDRCIGLGANVAYNMAAKPREVRQDLKLGEEPRYEVGQDGKEILHLPPSPPPALPAPPAPAPAPAAASGEPSGFHMEAVVGPYAYAAGTMTTLQAGGLVRISLGYRWAELYGEGTVGMDFLRPEKSYVRSHQFGGGLMFTLKPELPIVRLYVGYLHTASDFDGQGHSVFTTQGGILGVEVRPLRWLVVDLSGSYGKLFESFTEKGFDLKTREFHPRDEFGGRLIVGVDVFGFWNVWK